MAENFNIYMSWNQGADHMYLPVMPEKIEIKRKGNGQTYDIIGSGQINKINARDLAEISFESFFPGRNRFPSDFPANAYYPFLASEVQKDPNLLLGIPKWYTDKLAKWQDSKYPVRFIYYSESMKINLPVSIEQFDRWEEAGSEGDVSYSITLKEYVFHAAARVKVETAANGNQVLKEQPHDRLDGRVPLKTYTMKKGDSLWSVAKLHLGDGSRWREIQKLNGLTDAQLKRLPIGTVLKLPDLKRK